MCFFEAGGVILFIKPLFTYIKYEYLEGKLLGVYISHPDIETDKHVYSLDLNLNREIEVIKYIKANITLKDFCLEDEEYEAFLKDLDNVDKFADCLIKLYKDTSFEGFEEIASYLWDYNKVDKVFYFKELNSLITVTGGYYSSFSNMDWGDLDYFFSLPASHVEVVYIYDI
jgi:hypothetical protein